MARKPSPKQKATAKVKLDNPTLEGGKLVEAGGYGPSVIKTPAKALESQGYKEALREFGLTEELVSVALVDDIKAKPGKRVSELNLGADILGMRSNEKPEGRKPPVVAVQIIIHGRDNAEDRTNRKTVVSS